MKSVSNKIPSLLYSLHLFEKLLDANFGERQAVSGLSIHVAATSILMCMETNQLQKVNAYIGYSRGSSLVCISR